MAEKVTLAVSWAAACGGCDVSILDMEERVLALAELAEIVYWPVALDFKRSDLAARPDNSVDIGLFNGAVRTAEQREDAELFAAKCKVLVAFGSCACFGGIPGLANLAPKTQLIETVYRDTPSTDNAEEIRPQTECTIDGQTLTLPALWETVSSLNQVVEVDLFAPGCPPPGERVGELFDAVARFAQSGSLPPPQTVLASDKALCDSCPRAETRTAERMARIVRPHEITADPSRCFLDQGLLCLGIATRGGCSATCIEANMPCRGCFGPTAEMLDSGAEALSAIGTLAGEANENDVAPHQMKKTVKSIVDPAGTFYRFGLPKAIINQGMNDKPKKDSP